LGNGASVAGPTKLGVLFFNGKACLRKSSGRFDKGRTPSLGKNAGGTIPLSPEPIRRPDQLDGELNGNPESTGVGEPGVVGLDAAGLDATGLDAAGLDAAGLIVVGFAATNSPIGKSPNAQNAVPV